MNKKIVLLFLISFLPYILSAQMNADFEQASITNPVPPSTIVVTATNAVSGWTITSGSNSTWGATGNCTNTTAITGNPNACDLISPGATGHIDAIIGPSYPIYSVFGPTTATYPSATTANGFQCYGDWFIKINNQTPGAGVTRIVERINVTSSNNLLNFAFMNVLEGGHCCCDNSGFKLKVFFYAVACVGALTTTSCPSFSAANNASLGCTPSGACASMVNSSSYSVSTVNSSWIYNKWQKCTFDLSPFIGNCVLIEVTAFDCPYGTHAGYTYFDSQASPNEMIVNGTVCMLSGPNPTISTCGVSTTTLTAPSAAWGYTWTIPGPTTIAGVQTITTNVTGNHTLTMNGSGLCSPVVRIINLINSPAPNLAVNSITQTSCTNSISAVSLSMTSGSPKTTITPNYYVSFLPVPSGTLGVSANSGIYDGLATGVNTITITDSVGCFKTTTLNILPNPCTGIREINWNENISIAPNPNNGKFTVTINANIENAEIKIVNAIGQEVFKQNIKQGANEINVGVLAKGIYHYIITQNKQSVNRGKILIE